MQHILHDFDQAIFALRAEVITMAGKARHNLERAIHALLQRNIELSNAVIADDDEVDDHERHIDQLGMDILIRFHPMAGDLRLVISSMKISMNLERICDHATNIAKRARKMSASQEIPDATIIEPIYMMADKLLRDAIEAYTDSNSELAASLKMADDGLDRAHKAVIAQLSSRLEQGGANAENQLHLILVTRSLERIGDLSVNIGEDAVFISEARDIRHEQRNNKANGGFAAPQ